MCPTSKEITEPVTLTWHSTPKVLPLGKDSGFTTFEAFGVVMSDEGKGLFHEATFHATGSILVEKGVSKNFLAYGYYLFKNGDKVFVKVTRDEGKVGTPMKGKVTIIGGTGKCAGIQGSSECTEFFLLPAVQGISQGYFKQPIKYTLS